MLGLMSVEIVIAFFSGHFGTKIVHVRALAGSIIPPMKSILNRRIGSKFSIVFVYLYSMK